MRLLAIQARGRLLAPLLCLTTAVPLLAAAPSEEGCHTEILHHGSFHGSATLSVPGFDAELGCLTTVSVLLETHFEGAAGYENLSLHSTRAVDEQWVNDIHLSHGGLEWAEVTHYRNVAVDLPPFDGALDYRGLSGHTFTDLSGGTEWSVTITPKDTRFESFLAGEVTFQVTHEHGGSAASSDVASYRTSTPAVALTVCYHYTPVERYCVAGPNSTGKPARITAAGTTSVSDGTFTLIAEPVPHGERGFFVYSPDQANLPMGNGRQCVGDTTLGFVMRFGPGVAGPDERLQLLVDFDAPPDPAGLIVPGSVWNFQAWYRDLAAGFPVLNSTDGLRVTFCP